MRLLVKWLSAVVASVVSLSAGISGGLVLSASLLATNTGGPNLNGCLIGLGLILGALWLAFVTLKSLLSK